MFWCLGQNRRGACQWVPVTPGGQRKGQPSTQEDATAVCSVFISREAGREGKGRGGQEGRRGREGRERGRGEREGGEGEREGREGGRVSARASGYLSQWGCRTVSPQGSPLLPQLPQAESFVISCTVTLSAV